MNRIILYLAEEKSPQIKRNALYLVVNAILFLAVMLTALTPAFAQKTQEGDGVKTSVSTDEDLAGCDEKVETNDPTAAAWSYALGFELYDWKEDFIFMTYKEK